MKMEVLLNEPTKNNEIIAKIQRNGPHIRAPMQPGLLFRKA